LDGVRKAEKGKKKRKIRKSEPDLGGEGRKVTKLRGLLKVVFPSEDVLGEVGYGFHWIVKMIEGFRVDQTGVTDLTFNGPKEGWGTFGLKHF